MSSTGLVLAACGAKVVNTAWSPIYTICMRARQAQSMLRAAIAVAPQLDTTFLRENTHQLLSNIKCQIRCAKEPLLAQSGVRSMVIRAGKFFGSGTGSWFEQALVKRLQHSVLTQAEQADVPTACTYLLGRANTSLALAAQTALVKLGKIKASPQSTPFAVFA